jgi:hypothetical protein
MDIESNVIENPVLETENYTYVVFDQTLENRFPVKREAPVIEDTLRSAPVRSPEERANLKKNLFFRRK